MIARPARSALLMGLLCLAATGCGPRSRTVVLVTVPGLRADAVDASKTPGLSHWSTDGARLVTFVTPVPDAVPALAALTTGQDPEALGVRYGDLSRVPASASLLAERLARAGFSTAAFIGQSEVSSQAGFSRGFQEWRGPSGATDQAVTSFESDRVDRGTAVRPASELVDQVGAWLRAHASEKNVFLWVHLGDLVAPVAGTLDDAVYRETLRKVDGALGDLRETLKTYGRDRELSFAVVSLHGLALGAGGETLHGLTLVPEVVKVPVLLSRDAKAPSGTTTLTHVLDGFAAPIAPPNAGAAAAPDVRANLPSRLYGWPDPVARVGTDGTLSTVTAPAPDAERVAVLRDMAEVRRRLTGGDVDGATQLLAALTEREPRALAPRSILTDVLQLPSRVLTPDERALAARNAAAIASIATDSVARRIDAARVLCRSGARDQALPLLRGAAASTQATGESLGVARAFAECSSNEEALAIVEKAAAAEPAAADLQEWLGDMFSRTGNGFRARTAYENALKLGAKNANLTAKLGDALAGLGEKDAALQRYGDAVKLDPGYRYPNARAAELLIERKEYGAAAQALVMSAPPTGDAVTDALVRSRLLSRRGLMQAAVIELEKALKERPDDERLNVELARVLREAGGAAKAQEILDAALAKHPEGAFALVERARVEALVGNEAAALDALERAEKNAGPGLTDTVHADPAFRKFGAKSRLAAKAGSFAGKGTGVAAEQ